jgi:hypothetical protein
MQRRRFKQSITLTDRLASFAKEVRERASLLRPGPEQNELLEKARKADAATHIERWINSSELRPPK